MLLGYRYLRLGESLTIREDLSQFSPEQDFDIKDEFRTRNEFHGGEIGVVWMRQSGPLSVEMLGKRRCSKSSSSATSCPGRTADQRSCPSR